MTVWGSIPRRPGTQVGGSACSACMSAPGWSAGCSRSSRLLARARPFSCAWQPARGPSVLPIMSEHAAPLRILLADDHVTVRHGLRLLIDSQADMKVVSEASDGNAAVRNAIAMKPDVIVMDISMPGMNGLAATRALKQQQPGVAIVTLTRHADDAYVQELLRAGVSGYVLKQSAPTELLQAIRAAAAGGQYLDSTLTPRVTARLLGRADKVNKPAGTPSERESDVLRLIASGHSNKEIAGRLSLSVKTVEAHKANAMRKLGLTGRIDIVKYAVLQGWLENA